MVGLEELKNLIDEAGFSMRAKEKLIQILTEAKNRGSITPEEKIKLLEIVEADMALDKVELEARKEVISVLEDFKKALEK